MSAQMTLWEMFEPILSVFRRPKPGVHAEIEAITRPVVPPAPEPIQTPRRKRSRVQITASGPAALSIESTTTDAHIEPTSESMQDRYDTVARAMLNKYEVRVRKWRTNMSGIAWYVTYRDGRIQRLIEAPRPRGPMSVAIFLHEIGHHAIGFNVYKPRCLEEFHAWRWSLEAMEAHGLNITDAVRYRMHASLWYAVCKAKRRGIKSIPTELEPFLNRPVKPRKARSQRGQTA